MDLCVRTVVADHVCKNHGSGGRKEYTGNDTGSGGPKLQRHM